MNVAVNTVKRGLTYLYRRADTICVASSPRSGSTWLAETLVRQGRLDWVDEPLRLKGPGEALRHAGFTARTCLIDASPDRVQMVSRVMDQVVTGRVGRLEVAPAIRRRLLLKFVRLNRMMAWTVERYQLKRNVLLVRHPCAVIASKLAIDHQHSKWSHATGPTPDVPKYLLKKVNSLSNGQLIRTLAINWAIDHRIPLYDFPPNDTLLVFYEDLVSHFAREWHRVAKHCGVSGNFVENRRSSTASRDFDPGSQISKWKNMLTPGMIDEVLTTCHAIGVDIYNEDVLPGHRPG